LKIAIGFIIVACLKTNPKNKIMATKPIPKGYHTITPYLTVNNADNLLRFLKKAFNAEEINVAKGPDGKIANAEIKIGDSMIMVADANEKFSAYTTTMYMYVPDTDKTYKQALSAGGMSTMEPADQFYGDRNAGVKDPSGNTWWIATHVEDVTPKEMQKRMEKVMAEQHN
jgi:PhnB protein